MTGAGLAGDYVTDLRGFDGYAEALAAFEWHVPERFNVVDVVHRRRNEGRPALFSVGGRGGVEVVGFDGLDAATARLAAAFRDLGFGPRSRACVILPSTIEGAIAQLGALRAGAVVAPLRRYATADGYRHELDAVRPDLVVCERELIAELRSLTGPATVFVAGDRGAFATWTAGAQPGLRRGRSHLLLADLLAEGGSDDRVEPTLARDPAFVTFTSGTTGPPKAVVQPHGSYLTALPAFQMFTSLAPDPGDVVYTSLGWSTPGGTRPVVVPAWAFGAAVVGVDHELAARETCELLTGFRVTRAYLMPNVLRALGQLGDEIGDYDWSALRAIMYAGEAIGPSLQRLLESRLGVDVNPYYGASEVVFLAAACGRWFTTPTGSTGRRVPGRHLGVIDEETLELAPPGAVGILGLHVDDPGLCVGYLEPVSGESTFGVGDIASDHFLTSDLGRIDDQGNVWYIGRRGQVITAAGGALVAPTDVEDAALATGIVGEAAALQLGGEDDGQQLVVCVTLRGDAAPEHVAETVARAVRERFGAELEARRVLVLEEIPFTVGTRKIDRRVLRAQLESDTAPIVADVCFEPGGPARQTAAPDAVGGP